MIVSITCRHDTKENVNRREIERVLSQYKSEVTRARVVFNKEGHQKNADNSVTCHLSLSVPGKPSIDIYERQASEMRAFIRATERGSAQLVRRLNQSKLQTRSRARPVQSIELVTEELRSWEA